MGNWVRILLRPTLRRHPLHRQQPLLRRERQSRPSVYRRSGRGLSTAGESQRSREGHSEAAQRHPEQCSAPRVVESWRQLEGVNVVPAFGPVHVHTTVGESLVSQSTPQVGHEILQLCL